LFKELLEVQQEIRCLTLIGKELNEVRERLILDINGGCENLCETLNLVNQKLESINCKYEKALLLERKLEKKLEFIV
jgi:hypothetical protein